jgi:hypothetical protein
MIEVSAASQRSFWSRVLLLFADFFGVFFYFVTSVFIAV